MSRILSHLAAAAVGVSAVAAVLGVHIHHLRRRLAAAEHRAAHDPLTGLANRQTVLAHLRAATGQPDAAALIGVILFDLDDFKAVNDTPGIGHSGGDRLLCTVARLLRALPGPVRLVARLGGDEFAVVVDGDVETTFAAAHEIRSLIIGAPFDIDGHIFDVGASVGLVSNHSGLTANQLLHYADLAMYEAKRAGGGIAIYRTSTTNRKVIDRPARRCRDRRQPPDARRPAATPPNS
ncbi:GGDEF domain-containing protein [Phytohabitans aurantiacus]|uniref:GGDEF domain-containing protein n=1 Tax=Phytohabitans aurantiacus TaxID=3016789 RepID=A0ABQ5R398_9ACTN|nr:GGDEF domain-containing protein [Phytohabitans aurantiacus]GLI00667.1 hypothetical protein Pa4123_59430 [Phytohabitans aurantiacus]